MPFLLDFHNVAIQWPAAALLGKPLMQYVGDSLLGDSLHSFALRCVTIGGSVSVVTVTQLLANDSVMTGTRYKCNRKTSHCITAMLVPHRSSCVFP